MFAPYNNDNNLVIDTRDYLDNRGRLFQLLRSSRLDMAEVISTIKLHITVLDDLIVYNTIITQPWNSWKHLGGRFGSHLVPWSTL